MLSKSDSNFENDPRRKQEIRLRPYADGIYRSLFGADISIERFDHNTIILDKEFAIDVKLTLRTGQILLGQEKFLSKKYASYNSLTVEYMQNANERGDWFKLSPQIYFTGYEADNGFYPWVLVDWVSVVIETLKDNIIWQDNSNKDGRAQATFRFVNINSIPKECIIAKSQEDNNEF